MRRSLATGAVLLAMLVSTRTARASEETGTPSTGPPTWTSGRGRARGSAGDAKAPAVWFDYLPNVLYERDTLTVCLGARAAAGRDLRGLSLRARLLDGDGGVIRDEKWKLFGDDVETPGAERPQRPPSRRSLAEAQRQIDFGRIEWKRLVVDLTEKGRAIASASAVCNAERDPFPKVAPSGERLVDGAGRIAVFRLRRRTRKEDRSWLLVRRMSGALKEGEAPARTALFGERLPVAKGEAGAFSELISGMGTKVEDLTGAPDADATVPILGLLASVGSKAAGARSRAGVLFLPSRDVDRGTPLGEYRRAVDLAILRVKTAGCAPVAVVGPVNVSAPRKQLDKYVDEARAAAWGHKVGFVDTRPVLLERYFALDPKRPKVLGPAPNLDGRKALARLVFDELKKMSATDE